VEEGQGQEVLVVWGFMSIISNFKQESIACPVSYQQFASRPVANNLVFGAHHNTIVDSVLHFDSDH